MDQKSEEKSFPAVPVGKNSEGTDKAWEMAEHEVMKPKPSVNCIDVLHYFERVSGTDVKCRKCHVGYRVPIGTQIQEGHVYIDNKFVI